MLHAGISPIAVYCVEGSYLQAFLEQNDMDYQVIKNKTQLVDELDALNFDYFIANGLPIILPITRLRAKKNKEFINIHPSALPDLKGVDPVPGAVLYGRNSGATCHFMDDGIDTGDIISQITLQNHDDLDAAFLYQLSFRAEVACFREALLGGFKQRIPQQSSSNDMSYRFKENDLEIDFSKDDQEIIRKILAFNTPSKKARFSYSGQVFKVTVAKTYSKRSFSSLFESSLENQVALIYQNNILVKRSSSFLLLGHIEGNLELINESTVLK